MPDQSQTTVDPIKILLAEGLDLCVRARKLEPGRAPFFGQKAQSVLQRDQYDKDLADWEARARKALGYG